MELIHQIFPTWHIYLDMFLVGFATYGFLRIKKKIKTEIFMNQLKISFGKFLSQYYTTK